MVQRLSLWWRCLSTVSAVAFCLAASVRPAAAVITYTNLHEVVATTLTAHSITPIIGGGYRMYLTSGSYHIASASSTDLVNWTLEPGIRLTTSTDLDTSSITAVTVHLSTNADFYRMYYVGISSINLFNILSATSTDGLTFGKESAFNFQVATPTAHIGQLNAFDVTTGTMSLFYISDVNNGNNPADYRMFSSSSADGGISFNRPVAILSSTQALGVSVSTLTDGKTRIYYTTPLPGNTTAAQVLSGISTNGSAFTEEAGVRLATNTSTNIGPPIVIKSTNGYQWHLFSSFLQPGTTIAIVSRSLARTPVVKTFTPAKAVKGNVTENYAITGEIFDTTQTPIVTFTQSGSTIGVLTTVVASDISITGTFATSGMKQDDPLSIFVDNSDGIGTLASVLIIILPPGSVDITDNLFRPLKGGSAQIDIVIPEGGDLIVRLYTVSGSLVTTLYNGPAPVGRTVLNWPGRTSAGNVVSSGVYLLTVDGPNIRKVKKIVVIK
ncbi:MAG: hypothetical protein COB53_07115 [Elusimicrobia bacterium]|nr:MAG: hypothetical protein COB53_07115 [Elusimicrobiota bacterium]